MYIYIYAQTCRSNLSLFRNGLFENDKLASQMKKQELPTCQRYTSRNHRTNQPTPSSGKSACSPCVENGEPRTTGFPQAEGLVERPLERRTEHSLQVKDLILLGDGHTKTNT